MNALINAHTHRGRSRSPYVGLTSNVLPEAQRSHTGVSSDYVQKANHEWFPFSYLSQWMLGALDGDAVLFILLYTAITVIQMLKSDRIDRKSK
jgi:hypothetical protein